MIKHEFVECLNTYTSDPDQQLTMWNEIERSYSKSDRHYHNLTHLNSILTELKIHQNQFSHWDVIVFAIAYHDLVYNTSASNNEEQSAAIAMQRLNQIGVSEQGITFCKHLILATKNHEPSDRETNLFTDADLAVLGSDAEAYQTYAKKIRLEYSIFSDTIYYAGREKVLIRFLKMSNIYKSKEFSDKYEFAARANLQAELDALSMLK
jgi:predicted metal-dependent HD superfamily phosphohydrolase